MNALPFTSITACRSCGSSALASVFNLGHAPLSDGFVPSTDTSTPTFPLEVLMCQRCALVQLRHTVAPGVLFADDYPYFSSYTQTVVDNAKDNIEQAVARFEPNKEALFVEIAANDGYLLKQAAAMGFRTLGIDPARGPVEAARGLGLDMIHAFFTEALAHDLVRTDRAADLIFGNNVLAHVADIGNFLRGVRTLLKPEGTAIFEVPYLKDLIEHNAFDTIYHEHICYFSVTALQTLFSRHGLRLVDVTPIAIHGGSIRIFVRHRGRATERLFDILATERTLGLDGPDAFRTFAKQVQTMGERLCALLTALRAQGKRIVGYGAAAKGTILLNHFGIGTDLLDWIADKNPYKHGLFVPGAKIGIVEPARITSDRPDYILILPWNHKEEIMRQLADIRSWGGRFIIPVPVPAIID